MADTANTPQAEEVPAPDFMNMSDEEMAAFDPSTLASFTAAAPAADLEAGDPGDHDLDDKEPAKAEDKQDDAQNTTGATDEGDADNKGKDKEEGKGDDTAAAAGKTDPAAKGKESPADKADPDAGKGAETDPAKADADANTAPAIDYEAAYKQLTAPFKANGREMKVDTVEDAVALMKMGANYNKKMQGLKPSLKILKLLENNNLLDESKLGFLIDLDKKNPEAINKLVKDSGIDPLDMSADKASEYKPGTYTVDERELELDDVINELAGSESLVRTLDVVGNKWDKDSKGVIASNPNILRIVNDHVELGIYDLIAAEVERERTFGRLKGLSDLEAYRQVGDKMDTDGRFAHLGVQAKEHKPADVKVEVAPPPKKEEDPKLRDKKRAASSTKTTVPAAKVPEGFNPLSLSDEEFKNFKF